MPAPEDCRLAVNSAVIIEGHAPEEVWTFMRRPSSAALLQAAIKKAYSVPGTGPGIGEMLVYETERDGSPLAYVLTVTEETLGRSFSAAGEIGLPDGRKMLVGQTWAVDTAAGGARAAITAWYDFPAVPDAQAKRTTLEALQAEADATLRCMKRYLET
jgi:hypothetical protein